MKIISNKSEINRSQIFKVGVEIKFVGDTVITRQDWLQTVHYIVQTRERRQDRYTTVHNNHKTWSGSSSNKFQIFKYLFPNSFKLFQFITENECSELLGTSKNK